MKKGFIFLLLAISLGVFDVGSVGADAQLDYLLQQQQTIQKAYTDCLTTNADNPSACDTQAQQVSDASQAIYAYQNPTASQADNLAFYLDKGTKIFDDTSKSVQDKSAVSPDNVARYLKSINDIKIYFIDKYNNPSFTITGTPTDPQTIYEQAMKTTSDVIRLKYASDYCNGTTSDVEGCNLLTTLADVLEREANPTPGIINSNTQQSAQQNLQTNIKNIGTDTSACSFSLTKTFSVTSCIDVALTFFIKHTLISWGRIILWMSSEFLNTAYSFTVFDSSDSISSIISSLYPVWQTIKQIINYCIFFSSIYVGGLYMLNLEKGQEFIKRYIPWFIVFAIFANFSYPATKALTDISNIISLKIYSSALGDAGIINNNIGAGGEIMKSLHFQTLVGEITSLAQADGQSQQDFLSNINSPIPALMVFFEMLYASFIFIMVSLLLMMRSVVLIFIITASPFLLINKMVPKLGDYASKMREQFFFMLALPVVFSLMLFLVIQLIGSMNFLSQTGDNSTVIQVFNVAIMMISLYIMYTVTKSVSGTFGKSVEGWAGKIASTAMMATPAGALRMTAGRLGGAMLNKETGLGKWVDRNRGTVLGDAAHKFGGTLANSNYDMRNLSSMNELASMGGIKMSKGSTNTFKSNLDNQKRKLAKDVMNTDHAVAKARLIENAGGYSADAILPSEKAYLRKGLEGEIQKIKDLETGAKKKDIYDNLSESERESMLEKDQTEAIEMDKNGGKEIKKTISNTNNNSGNNSNTTARGSYGGGAPTPNMTVSYSSSNTPLSNKKDTSISSTTTNTSTPNIAEINIEKRTPSRTPNNEMREEISQIKAKRDRARKIMQNNFESQKDQENKSIEENTLLHSSERNKQIFEEESLKVLKSDMPDWYNNEYSGVAENGYLISRKDGTTLSLPSQNMSGKNYAKAKENAIKRIKTETPHISNAIITKNTVLKRPENEKIDWGKLEKDLQTEIQKDLNKSGDDNMKVEVNIGNKDIDGGGEATIEISPNNNGKDNGGASEVISDIQNNIKNIDGKIKDMTSTTAVLES